MKNFCLIILVLNFSSAFGQLNPATYFKLDIRYYADETEKYLGVSPEIKLVNTDDFGIAIQKHPRRFRYILLNKSEFQNRYEKLYPDTVLINTLYTNSLRENKLFMLHFDNLTKPFSKLKFKKLVYNKDELMQVAARFFYVEGMKKDSTINSYICINLNGIKNAFKKEYTVLEAFSFEAIFEQFKVDGQPNPFMKNFKTYINQAIAIEKPQFKNEKTYVENIRKYAFVKMEKDSKLQSALLNYYQLNKSNLPFEIVN